MGNEEDVFVYETNSGTIKVDINALKNMKHALAEFFDLLDAQFPEKYLERKNQFKAELEKFAVMITDNIPKIGAWRLQLINGELQLIRFPRPPSLKGFVTYHATIELIDERWKVVSFSHQSEIIR